jgi:hypothetical protein
VNIDRIVITTFPGYFYSQIKCLRSIQQYAAGFPVDIIVDDFGTKHWPDYVSDCEQYITATFPDADIQFHRFSDFPGMELVKTGGWFRQQLVKLYLDKFVSGNSWLVVDADVEFTEPIRLNTISATVKRGSDPIGQGNRHYVKFMLGTDQPWAVNENEYWCMSSVPFRHIPKDLLTELRHRVETLHGQSLFDLHLDLFEQQRLVAFDPAGDTMIMSEFQLIEIFRHRYYHSPLPIGECTASHFNHSSVKDWHSDWSTVEQYARVSDNHWHSLQEFGKHHA